MTGFYLSYPETPPDGFGAGHLLCDMIGGLFCDVVFEFLVEGILEILFVAM
jgi:hypothetical protein